MPMIKLVAVGSAGHAPATRRQPRASIAVALAAAAVALLGGLTSWAPAFAPGSRVLSATVSGRSRAESLVALRAAEAPSDAEIMQMDGGLKKHSKAYDPETNDPETRPWMWKRRPKREIPGTVSYARRELNEEAERLRPYVEPLLHRQMSIKEMTFALNRHGSKLRHLLWRPPPGVPVFREYKVLKLLRRMKTPIGRLNNWKRPPSLPPNAPGAAYPPMLGDVYAEVPPLKPWTPKTIRTTLVKDHRRGQDMLEVQHGGGFWVGGEVTIGGEVRKCKSVVWNGANYVIAIFGTLGSHHSAGTEVTTFPKVRTNAAEEAETNADAGDEE
mmetsp:Transcript_7966/g.19774  ORF Transcript_7966/g.19774 Transcript_7966/m.19774 type:complete len:328 (+) Transcript_7966:131-1114(+)